mmetsp:Transcript_27305/g.68965  ORF Transcript_27305/g.68965 Transcript_27305/m.68965 type:complete len:219 (-) Transcript_27305:1141-1797(-)
MSYGPGNNFAMSCQGTSLFRLPTPFNGVRTGSTARVRDWLQLETGRAVEARRRRGQWRHAPDSSARKRPAARAILSLRGSATRTKGASFILSFTLRAACPGHGCKVCCGRSGHAPASRARGEATRAACRRRAVRHRRHARRPARAAHLGERERRALDLRPRDALAPRRARGGARGPRGRRRGLQAERRGQWRGERHVGGLRARLVGARVRARLPRAAL